MKLLYFVGVLVLIAFSGTASFADTSPESIRLGKTTDGAWGYVADDGKVVANPSVLWVGEFSEGLAYARVGCGLSTCSYGFIDTTGAWIIKPRFPVAGRFSEGLAPAMDRSWKDGKYGYIDKTGSFVISPQFDRASPFSEGLAAVGFHETVVNGTHYHVLEVEGRYGFTSARCGYIDKTGKMVISPLYAEAGDFHEGLAAVKLQKGLGGKWGYIDITGKMVIDARFDWADQFGNGMAQVTIDKKDAAIDRTGKVMFCTSRQTE